MPRRPPPPGCITATEAIQRIGKSLYKYVEKGHLHPQGPATLKHKFYLESEVASIETQERDAFEETLHKIPAKFVQAKPSDVQSWYELAVRIFGHGTISAEKRRALIEREARGNYILKRDNSTEVVGYFYLQSLTHERIMQYFKDCRGSTITTDDIRKIEPGQHEMIIAGIGRDPRADRQYVAVLLHGFKQELEKWGSEGIDIKKFYAYSETIDGVFLCFSMGMELYERPRYIGGSPHFKFVIDVETSNIPLLQGYKRALQEYKRSQAPETPLIVTSPNIPLQREKASRIRSERASTSIDRPEGTITLKELAEQVQRSEKTLLGHLQKWDKAPGDYPQFEHIKIEIANRQGMYTRYFTAEQVARIEAWIEANTKKAQPTLFDE